MRNQLLPYLFIFLIPTSAFSQEECALPLLPDELYKPLVKIAMSPEADESMYEYCQRTVMRGVLNIMNGSDQRVADYARYDKGTWVNGDTWDNSILPLESSTKYGFDNFLKFGPFPFYITTISELEESLPTMMASVSEVSKNKIKAELDFLQKTDFRGEGDISSLPGAERMKDASGILPRLGICSTLTLTSAVQCAEGLKSLTEIMGQKLIPIKKGLKYNDLKYTGINMSLFPLYLEILTEPKYAKGLRIMALKILSKVKSKEPPQGDYFSDLKASFVEGGLSEKEAYDLAWNVVGLIASAGPGLAMRLTEIGDAEDATLAKAALSTISSAIPLLDARSAKTGHIYSYPPTISATCNTGKGYHFWMSAYLSRRLAQELDSVEGAQAATYTAQKAYMIFARAGDRKPERALSVPSHDDFNQVIRMDLAYGAAGSVFGANSRKELSTKTLEVDRAIVNLIHNAGDQAPMDIEEAKALTTNDISGTYFRWQKIFSSSNAYFMLSR